VLLLKKLNPRGEDTSAKTERKKEDRLREEKKELRRTKELPKKKATYESNPERFQICKDCSKPYIKQHSCKKASVPFSLKRPLPAGYSFPPSRRPFNSFAHPALGY